MPRSHTSGSSPVRISDDKHNGNQGLNLEEIFWGSVTHCREPKPFPPFSNAYKKKNNGFFSRMPCGVGGKGGLDGSFRQGLGLDGLAVRQEGQGLGGPRASVPGG